MWKPFQVLLLLAAGVVALDSQTFTRLFSFEDTNGALPSGQLIQGTNGDLYGTASSGGGGNGQCGGLGCGTIFEISTSGELRTVHRFCSQPYCLDGDAPEEALVQTVNGDLYGTTPMTFANGTGTIFKITPSGTLTTLYTFCSQAACSDGENPVAGLVQTIDGNLYGTTAEGGSTNCAIFGCGTVFRITPQGALTTVYTFCEQTGCPDGQSPNSALVQTPSGDLFGTTALGGIIGPACAEGCGTIFRITPGGVLTTLYSFCGQAGCPKGQSPAGLIEATNGDLYGTTQGGGTSSMCGTRGCGTVFQITQTGTLTTLYSFCSEAGCPDGSYPVGNLIQATDGAFYGMTSGGGSSIDGGTIFKIDTSGNLTTLYSFCYEQAGCLDGQSPVGALAQDTNGNLYGMTAEGGANDDGVVFSLSVGLGPFVRPQTTSGQVGSAVNILGTGLTDVTSVTFDGTPSVFKLVSSSDLVAIVPNGASSGLIRVVSPSGTLPSNVPFHVLP
jgi:uncharacterized repeat protein (TIGR03803 family)